MFRGCVRQGHFTLLCLREIRFKNKGLIKGTPYEKTKHKKKVVSEAIPIEANVTRINWWAANTCE